jgi:ribosomal protein L17
MLRNMVTSIIMEERIETTVIKAKAVRPQVEKMITLGKKGDLAARRQAASYLMTGEAVTKLFDTVAPRFRPQGRISAHRPHRLAEGRRRREGVHRTAGQRAGDR